VWVSARSQAGPRPQTKRDWWPNQLKLNILRQHSALSDPMDASFDYNKECESFDLDVLKKDIVDLMAQSQDWWPTYYGHSSRLTLPSPLLSLEDTALQGSLPCAEA
jgi:catalase-peroxidase